MRKIHLKYLYSSALVCMLLIFIGCSSSPNLIFERSLDKYDYVIAKADKGYSLSMPEFYDKIARTNFLQTGGIVDTELVNKLVDSIIIDTLIGLRADTVNIRSYYDYYFRLRESSQRLLINTFYEQAIFHNVKVDSQEVVDYYNAHPEEFKIDEQVLVSHILISARALKGGPDSLLYNGKSPEEMQEIEKQVAFDLRDSVDSKESFINIAKKYSNDEVSARKGGLIGWAGRNVYAKPFDSVAFSAKPGDIVGPYHDRDGWHILYINDHIESGISPFTLNAYSSALIAVQSEKSKEYGKTIFDTLYDDINIVYNEEFLDSNSYFVDNEIWAAIVNGQDTIDFGSMRTGEENLRRKYNVSNSTPPMKKVLIDFLARRLVIVQAARKMGLDTLPEVRNNIRAIRHKLARLIVESQSADLSWEPSQELMKEYYEKNISDYMVERPLRVQQIVVNNLSLAQFIKDQANAGVDFIELANEYYPGDESVRTDLANLGWVGPEDVSKEFFDVAKVTRVGEVSDPVKTEYGYHLIKILEKKTSVPFEQARADIRKILKVQKELQEKEDFRNGLKQEFNLVRTGRIYPIHLKPFDQRKANKI